MKRRDFLTIAAPAALAPSVARSSTPERPALLGGKPVRGSAFPSWPVADEREDKALLKVLRSGRWYRGIGDRVPAFEKAYAGLTGTKYCLATNSGTSALLTVLGALGVGPGDEVIVPPYTFVATINVVLQLGAMPVFVDTDPATFQIDARKVEAAVTERTAAIMPVHLGGSAADLDTILSVAAKHKLPVVEDACQAHLGEWRGRKVGGLGVAGCFSFQGSKNLNCGEGGAVISNDQRLIDRCYAFHSNGRAPARSGYDFSYMMRGLNLRMTEFQGALLLEQMTRLEEQARRRGENARYLTSLLNEIPGIQVARQYEGCTRSAYHLFMFRYDNERFSGLSRARFLKALEAEGIPNFEGYSPLNREPFIKQALTARAFQRVYSREDIAHWEARNQCPENDRLCREAVWFTQTMLLGTRQDMDQIAEAVRKIQAFAVELARTA